MTETVAWTCPSCRAERCTPFCPRCGEEPVLESELSWRGLAEKLVHALTSIDARALRTTWELIRHPGSLTASWIDGVRKPYIAPFQLFLIANVVFFALQSITGINVFSSSLDSHLHHQDWSEFAQRAVAHRLTDKGITLEAYSPLFDRAVVLYAKTLIVLMAMPFALLLPIVCWDPRRPFMLHVVFALHLYAFLLLVFCVALLAARASVLVGGPGLDAPVVDNVISVLILATAAAYCHVAIGRVYGAAGFKRPLQAALLAAGVGALVLGYRFILFLITLALT